VQFNHEQRRTLAWLPTDRGQHLRAVVCQYTRYYTVQFLVILATLLTHPHRDTLLHSSNAARNQNERLPRLLLRAPGVRCSATDRPPTLPLRHKDVLLA
jgi:hypothetical protein